MADKKFTKKEMEQKLEELTLLLQRVQADFENYKKRTEKERQEFSRYISAAFTSKLLPVIDSFEQAFKNCHDDGIKLLYSQMMDILSREGLKEIECIGKAFDPFMHEAMMQAASDKEAGIVLEELQKGFMFGDAVIRHAKVKVAKNETDNKKDTTKGSV